MTTQLVQRAPDLWTLDAPLTLLGAHLGARSTVVRLPDGGLWLHAPVPLSEVALAELQALGPLRHVVAPNTMHHLSFAAAKAGAPEARGYAPQGLIDKVKGLPVDEALGDAAPSAWGGALEQRRFEGASKLDEVVFFHPSSRTLVLTDIAFNMQTVEHWWSRQFFRMTGAYGRLGPTRLLMSFVKDVPAAKRSVAAMCADWDFDRVVLAHGEVVEAEGRALLRAAWEAV